MRRERASINRSTRPKNKRFSLDLLLSHEGTGWSNKWNLNFYSPGIQAVVYFLLICSRREGTTAAVLTLDTAADESKKKKADRVARSPARLCSRDGTLTLFGTTIETPCVRFSCFLLCVPLIFLYSLSRCVFASSVQQPSTALQQAPVVLVSFVFCLIL